MARDDAQVSLKDCSTASVSSLARSGGGRGQTGQGEGSNEELHFDSMMGSAAGADAG